MQPIERFKKTITEGNLWIYVLSLARTEEICNEDVPRLVFEKFGIMPSGFLVARVLFMLKQQGLVSNEKHLGKNAYKTTPQGIEQIEQMKILSRDIVEKISK